MPKLRLDELLVQRSLAPTRAQAKALILSGRVRLGTARLDKPGKEYPHDLALEIDQPPRFVSRGGEKLQAALEAFSLTMTGKYVLDVGASTGGFTDCALQAGAAHVTCLDVGRAQLHSKLRADPRIQNIEQTNARTLRAEVLPHRAYDAIVIDVSFISLRAILPSVWPFLKTSGHLVALVKPQFEAGKAEADRGQGIIRDPAIHERVLAEIEAFALRELPGCQKIGLIPSPITGGDGNREFLLGFQKG